MNRSRELAPALGSTGLESRSYSMMSLAVTKPWREPAGHQVTVWIVRMPDAHVTKGIEYAFLGKNAIGHHEVLDKSWIDRASRGRWCLCAKRSCFDPREY